MNDQLTQPAPVTPAPTAAPDQVVPPQTVATSQATAPVTAPAEQSTASTQGAAQTKMIGKYKVEVINDKCIGAASCVAIAPGIFKLNEQNIAEVISQDGDSDDMKLLAAQSCPTAAIIVTDTETGQRVWPLDM